MEQNATPCAVVLAAGKGTRMKSDLPKVATLLNGQPLVVHVIGTLQELGIQRIIVVVGFKKEIVMSLLKDYKGVEFVEQTEQLGTGHALLCAESKLSEFQGPVLVCCGDVPLIKKTSFEKLMKLHQDEGLSATVLSAEFSQPFGYGRLVRNTSGQLECIVEEKDATQAQKAILEVNTGTYVFQSPSVFSSLKTINTDNAQKEYYLPDLIKIYNQSGFKTGAYKLENPLESTGINSQEDLAYVHTLLEEGKV
jgi:UDP-N-acetylglucosamine pyrophosphorylase